MPGIVSSNIGTLDGREIVRVQFDSAETNLPALAQTLKNNASFYSLIVRNEAEREQARKILNSTDITVNPAEPHFVEPKYTLRSSYPELYYLDLTEQQAIALNSWSYFGGPMPDLLTASQKQLLPKLKRKLGQKSPRELTPRRSGQELITYRSQLLSWLAD